MSDETYKGSRDGAWGVWLVEGSIVQLKIPESAATDAEALNHHLIPLINAAREECLTGLIASLRDGHSDPDLDTVRDFAARALERARRVVDASPLRRRQLDETTPRPVPPERRCGTEHVEAVFRGTRIVAVNLIDTRLSGNQVAAKLQETINSGWQDISAASAQDQRETPSRDEERLRAETREIQAQIRSAGHRP